METLVRLQDIFYLYKNEMLDEITDDELLNFMREQYETVCFGDLTIWRGLVWIFSHRRSGPDTGGYRVTDGRSEYGQFDEVKRWDYELYLEALSGSLLEVMSVWYEMEELVPIVGRLARKYTSGDSTSISYEKAEQLMGAVLYCIREAGAQRKWAVADRENLTAETAYLTGAAVRGEKRRKEH